MITIKSVEVTNESIDYIRVFAEDVLQRVRSKRGSGLMLYTDEEGLTAAPLNMTLEELITTLDELMRTLIETVEAQSKDRTLN